eukprot:15177-Eustigmatos_ZCMA.PRE.1
MDDQVARARCYQRLLARPTCDIADRQPIPLMKTARERGQLCKEVVLIWVYPTPYATGVATWTPWIAAC